MDEITSDFPVKNKKVVIIGAGISGLAAAATLEESNFKDYIVVEAQSQIGGRICSIPWNDGWLELGAQFLHGRGSTLGKLAEEKGLLSDIHTGEGEGLYLREDGTQMDNKLVVEVDDIIKNILEDCETYAANNEIEHVDVEENIGQILRNRFNKYLKMEDDPLDIRQAKKELFDWNIRFLLIDNACASLEELSVKSWGKFKAVDGPEHNLFQSHYGAIVELIAEQLTQNNLRVNCPVERIEWNNEQVDRDNSKQIIVKLQNGEDIYTDCVIITCSLGVLKENYVKMFCPQLPTRYTTTIESLGFGMINKIFLHFDEAWWEPDVKGFQFLWNAENNYCDNDLKKKKLPLWTRDLTGFDVMKNHQNVLLGWIGGEGSYTVEKLTDEQIVQDSAKLFRYFLKNDKVPEAARCIKSCWAGNPYVRGGYSHITKKCDVTGVSPATLAEPIWKTSTSDNQPERLPILMFAGEATHDNYYSTTHGAYDTGVKQAQTFLKYFITK